MKTTPTSIPTRPLLEQWQGLARSVHLETLCDLPTSIQPLEELGQKLGVGNLLVKRDDRSALAYGGNKTRKLEFLLGEVRRKQHKEVLTFGYAGSNFALATSLYTHQLGMRCISMLLPQHNARYVRQNLLLGDYAGAELHTAPDTWLLGASALWQTLRHGIMQGKTPYWIPAGGSHPLGVLGFVNAAYELKAQIDQGLLPVPDYIYLALGSMGSAAGLDIGLRALNLPTRVIAVRVVPTQFGSNSGLQKLISKTLAFIRIREKNFPELNDRVTQSDVRNEFYGLAYGEFTEAGKSAARLAGDLAGLKLDGTYAAKAMAALMADARAGKLKDKTVLFWNTGNSRDVASRVDGLDYKRLPRSFHRYFEEPVQD